MIAMLDDYDWGEAFEYAYDKEYHIRESLPKPDYELSGFTREDVKHIQGYEEGANDEDSWIIYGELYDGRWFYLEAWCDYTGWD